MQKFYIKEKSHEFELSYGSYQIYFTGGWYIKNLEDLNIEFIDIQDDKLRLCVPYLLYKTHIEQNYKEIIIDNFNNNSSFKINDINFILKENLNEILDKEKEKTA